MATYTLKRGDTAPLIRDVLLDKDGNAVNLTGATIKFHMATWDRATVVIPNGAVTNWSGAPLDTTGQVEYAPASGDVVTAGVFRGEWQVTFAAGKVETWPDDGCAVVNIPEDLA